VNGPPPEATDTGGGGGAGGTGAVPEDAVCAKCGVKAKDRPLLPDPAIEEVWFCAPCWEERVRVTATHEFGYDNDFMEE
jgi:hypothetical protein